MHRVPKLDVKAVRASINVVLEELTKGRPEIGSSGTITKNEIEDLSRNAHVDPLYDGQVVLHPLSIQGTRNGVVGDMRVKVAATEVYIKEMTPMVVVVGG